MTLAGYVALSTPYALAVVSGKVDTIPCWAPPPDGVLGQRVALFGKAWHEVTAMNLTDFDGVKFGAKDRRRSGRIGTVEVIGYVQVKNPWDRKGIAGKNWPARRIPKRSATFHWLVGKPEVEINASIAGLTRLLVAYEDRPEYLQRIREYGDKYGVACLHPELQEDYNRARGIHGSKQE